jgi:hypothetical protein
MFTGFLFSKETCSGSMSKSRPLCYNGPVSTLCYARRKWQGNDGQRNKMEGARCFHSPADYSPAQFPSDHWRFIPGFQVDTLTLPACFLGHCPSSTCVGVQGSPTQSHHLFGGPALTVLTAARFSAIAGPGGRRTGWFFDN